MHTYESDEEKMLQTLKQEMEFLRYYCANMRLKSLLREKGEALQVEDDIMDYLHYSKSVISLKRQQGKEENYVLSSMEKMQKHKEDLQSRDERAYILLGGIAQLKEQEAQLLLDVYVRQYDKKKILQRLGGVVESTYHRRLKKALLHLALVLKECLTNA